MNVVSINNSTVLFPCHSWEDFPLHHREEKADGLLSCWISLWHPLLLHQTQALPNWTRADEPGEQLANTLVVIPEVSNSWLPTGFASKAVRQEAKLITGETCRWKILERTFPDCDLGKGDAGVNDFLALGYAYLQIKLMTHQLRSSSNLDEERFSDALLSAVKAWRSKSSEGEPTRDLLGGCFDLLLEEKNCYYPVEPELVDFVLAAKTTTGRALTRQLESLHPFSLLADTKTLEKVETQNPEAFNLIRQKVLDRQIDLVCCNQSELADPLLSPESSLNQIRQATRYCQEKFDYSPSTYARRRFGLSPSLPAILEQLEFEGVLHSTLDDGKFPYSSSSNMRWEGDEGNSILALGQIPKDARQSATFLNLGVDLGQAIDSAHVATFLLAHWPDMAHPCLNDLLNIQKHGALLGRMTTLNEYFANSYDPGYSDTYTADEYEPPYFKQSIQTRVVDPISRFTRYWHQISSLKPLRGLSVLVSSILKRLNLDHDWPSTVVSCETRINLLQTQIEVATELNDPAQINKHVEQIDAELQSIQSELLSAMCSASKSPSAVAESDEVVILNPLANGEIYQLKNGPNSNRTASLKSKGSVVLASSDSNSSDWIIETPAMSITPVSAKVLKNATNELANDATVTTPNSIRNEFFELVVDQETGALNNLNLHDRRKNLLSQQIALRIPGQFDSHGHPIGKARYSRMKCTNYRVESLSRITGQITTEGQLLDDDRVVAEFVQTFTISRGRKLIDIGVRIQPQVELTDSPNHYFCSRVAWKDESAELLRNAQHVRTFVSGQKFEATNYVEIVSPTAQLTLFPKGLPFQRRSDRRMLDTLLIAGSESEREFRFSIGVNVPYPLVAAHQTMTPTIKMDMKDAISAVAHSLDRANENCESQWFFHFNCRSIVATWWETIFDENDQLSGIRVRLRESQGRGGTLKIRSVFELESCVKTNFNNTHLCDAIVESDTASIDFSSFEYFQLQLNFAK